MANSIKLDWRNQEIKYIAGTDVELTTEDRTYDPEVRSWIRKFKWNYRGKGKTRGYKIRKVL